MQDLRRNWFADIPLAMAIGSARPWASLLAVGAALAMALLLGLSIVLAAWTVTAVCKVPSAA
jgi:type VI protein secretion system component VasF